MNLRINSEIVHNIGKSKKLVVMFHGYISYPRYFNSRIQELVNNISDVALHIPEAPLECEIYPERLQWYSMHRFDPNDDRKTVETLDECLGFYNLMHPGLEEAFEMVNPYIDNLLKKYGLSDEDLFICGFSQGAMLAIYTSLMRKNKIAGCVSFSGVVAGYDYLKQNAKSSPDFLLIHGNNDNLVRYGVLDFSKNTLEEIGCNVETHTIEGGKHQVTDEAVLKALEFINKRKFHKLKRAI